MMAKERTKIELVQVSAMIVMLFEDLSHGMMRNIYLKARPSGKAGGDLARRLGRPLGRRHPRSGHRGLQRQNLAKRRRRPA
jgi:hypothetical protein